MYSPEKSIQLVIYGRENGNCIPQKKSSDIIQIDFIKETWFYHGSSTLHNNTWCGEYPHGEYHLFPPRSRLPIIDSHWRGVVGKQCVNQLLVFGALSTVRRRNEPTAVSLRKSFKMLQELLLLKKIAATQGENRISHWASSEYKSVRDLKYYII